MKSPFDGKPRLTQLFGENPDYYKKFGFDAHEGIDLVPTSGSWDVLAIEGGEVVRDIDAPRDNYGNFVVVINWENNRAWWYCHLKENNVKNGDIIKAGAKIGVMGSTGKVTGAHLHLGLRYADEDGMAVNTDNGYKGFVDPLPVLKELGEGEHKDELAACLETHTSLMNQLEEQGKELKSKEKLLASANALKKTLSGNNDRLSREMEDLKQKRGDLQDDLESANKQIEEFEQEIETLSKRIESLKEDGTEEDWRSYYRKTLRFDIRKYEPARALVAGLQRALGREPIARKENKS